MVQKIVRADEFKAFLLKSLEKDKRANLQTVFTGSGETVTTAKAHAAFTDAVINYIRDSWDEFTNPVTVSTPQEVSAVQSLFPPEEPQL